MLSDLLELVSADGLTVPIGGDEYTIKYLSAVHGIALRDYLGAVTAAMPRDGAPAPKTAVRAREKAEATLAKVAHVEPGANLRFERLVLGSAVVDDLISRCLTEAQIGHIVQTSLALNMGGVDAAEATWEGKAPTPARPPTETPTR